MKMNKVLNVLLIVVAVILGFKFITSSFFIWLLVGAAVPQGIKYLCKTGVITKRGVYRSAYRYTAIGIVVLAVLRLVFFHTVGVSLLIGGLAGTILSATFLDGIVKK